MKRRRLNVSAHAVIILQRAALLAVALYGCSLIADSPYSGHLYAGTTENAADLETAEKKVVPVDRLLFPSYDLQGLLQQRSKVKAMLNDPTLPIHRELNRSLAESYLIECDILEYYREAGITDAGSVKSLSGKIRSRARRGLKVLDSNDTDARAILVGALLKLHTLRYLGEYHLQVPAIRQALEGLLKTSPDSEAVHLALGRFYATVPTLTGGDLALAGDHLMLIKETAAGRVWLVKVALAQGQPVKAVVYLDDTGKANSKNPGVLLWTGKAMAEAERQPIDRMQDLLRKGREEYDPALVGYARDLFESSLTLALDFKNKKGDVTNMPDPSVLAQLHYLIALSNLAECDILKFQRKQLDWATDEGKETILERTDLLIEQGKAHCDKAIALEPDVSEYHRVKGLLFVHLIRGMTSGMTQGPKAKRSVLKSLELDDGNPEAHEAIALMYYSNPPAFGGDVNKAIAELRTASKSRVSSYTLAFLGKCYLKKERYERAILYFKKALIQTPRNMEAEIFLTAAITAKQEEDAEDA